MAEEQRGLELPGVTEEDYQSAGSKFVTFPPGAKVGDSHFLDIEIGMVDWDTPGSSMKVPIKVTEEGPDKGKEEKLSFGVLPNGIWKGKEIYRAITGRDMPMKEGADGKRHPVIDPMALAGKAAVGHWQMQKGVKGGVVGAETVTYPKLVAILPAGGKPTVESLGI